MSLTLKEILELIDKVAESGISALEVERAGIRLRIEGKKPEVVNQHVYAPTHHGVGSPPSHLNASVPGPPALVPAGEGEDEEANESWHVITSPIVGTFYRAPNPESDPFVGVGDRIGKGSVICIVEAMKLMNEIESDVEGVIARIYPQNGQPVEYGEKLFAVQV
jgi:acetyl-CoA carboxylase biotin carboxyl carrier protein